MGPDKKKFKTTCHLTLGSNKKSFDLRKVKTNKKDPFSPAKPKKIPIPLQMLNIIYTVYSLYNPDNFYYLCFFVILLYVFFFG